VLKRDNTKELVQNVSKYVQTRMPMLTSVLEEALFANIPGRFISPLIVADICEERILLHRFLTSFNVVVPT
jgi:hypothetical protein